MLRLVTDEETKDTSEEVEELPAAALDAVVQHLARSEFLATLPRENLQDFAVILRTNDAYIVAGSNGTPDSLVSILESAKLSLVMANMTGDMGEE